MPILSWKSTLITTNPISGRQYRLADDRDRQWFSHENAQDGSGFGYLSWKLKRKVGFTYSDIGYGFPVELRKGPYRVLFSGQIVKITERSGQAGDEIEVWALGWLHTFGADTFNRIYCDTRYQQWMGSETPSGSFRPDRFDIGKNNQLRLKPRTGCDVDANDYTCVRYTFPFGETAKRFCADYDLELPSAFPGKLEVLDSDGNSLWSATATADGSIDVTTTGFPSYFEVRFYVTAAGQVSAATDTVYGELTNVKVYSVNVVRLGADIVARDIVNFLSVAGHGLSDRTDEIEMQTVTLEPCFFDKDTPPLEAIKWCCQFGTGNGYPLMWGVTMDERRRMMLKAQDLTTVKYVVYKKSAELERGGDWGASAQKVYAVYQDAQNLIYRTADRVDQGAIDDLGGYFRRQAIQIQGMTDPDLIDGALALWLAEHARPGAAGTFTVKYGAWTPDGRFVPCDEIQPGGLVQVREWRARNATLSPDDYRDNVTTFPLAGVRVDEKSRAVELIPRESSDAFERYMAIIQKLGAGD